MGALSRRRIYFTYGAPYLHHRMGISPWRCRVAPFYGRPPTDPAKSASYQCAEGPNIAFTPQNATRISNRHTGEVLQGAYRFATEFLFRCSEGRSYFYNHMYPVR